MTLRLFIPRELAGLLTKCTLLNITEHVKDYNRVVYDRYSERRYHSNKLLTLRMSRQIAVNRGWASHFFTICDNRRPVHCFLLHFICNNYCTGLKLNL
jgi:hypothetical protein